MRDCENCKHRVMKVEVGKGTPPEHFWGCECWECEFEPTTKNDLGVDCISRQAVIGTIYDNKSDFKNDFAQGFFADKIRELPSVTPQEPRWIPVSEKLPEPFTFVNATCRSLVDDRENWVVETIYLPIPKEVNKHGYSDWGNIPMLNWGEAEVIAWVERIIPQPYKAEIEPQERQKLSHRRVRV